MTKTILVTGGAGYIGCVLVGKLLDKKYKVIIHDKFLFGRDPISKFSGAADIIEGDLLKFDPAYLDGVDAVIHLGGLSNDPMANFNPVANYRINTVATDILLKACKLKKVRRFTFATTCSIYDMGFNAEDILKDEDTYVNPSAPYAISNYEAERILLQNMDDDFRPVLLRQATVYGWSPRMRFDLVVNTFLKDGLTKGEITVHCGGEMWRPLVDVQDVSAAHIACIEAPLDKVGGEIFNIVFRNYRILELAHYVVDVLKPVREVKINVDYSHTKSRSYRVSAKKIENEIGFKAVVPVQESLMNMLRQIQDNKITDLTHPKYYNIEWLKILMEAEEIIKKSGSIL